MENEVLKTIKKRRSVRAFKEEPIPEDKLETILKAAKWAPSAGNQQPWEFVVVREASIQEKLVQNAYGQEFIQEAPIVIVIGANKKRSAERYGKRGKQLYCLLDAAVATQNLMLAAHSLGFATCWVGAFKDAEVSETIGFPEHVRPVGIIPLGKPDEHPSPPSRYSLEKVVHENHFSE